MNTSGDDARAGQGDCDYINGEMAMKVVTKLNFVCGSGPEFGESSTQIKWPIELDHDFVRTFRTQKSVWLSNNKRSRPSNCLEFT